MSIGIIDTGITKLCDSSIRSALSDFISQPESYKKQFLQSNYQTAFDGYSYLGQKDSLNQYYTDQLHSFVLSDFQPINHFPKEFHKFLLEQWEPIKLKVKQVEITFLEKLNNPELTKLYNEDILGYMMSCNYYPKLSNSMESHLEARLSKHKDVSMFTVFPFGIDKGLSYQKETKNYSLGAKDTILIFSGYFCELATRGKIEALEHKVEIDKEQNKERFSFALFSIPKPNSKFKIHGEELNGKAYYQKYLSLF